MKKYLLMFVAIATLALGSCAKDTLAGTSWLGYDDGDPITVSFTTETNGMAMQGDEVILFTYTYSDGSGTMMWNEGGHSYPVPFTVNKTTLSFNFGEGWIVCNKQ